MLKACMFDEIHPQERVVPAEHRQFLYTNALPPADGVWVRLATYEAREPSHYAYQGIKLGRADDPAPGEPTLYFVTITIGALVVQVTGSTLPEWSFPSILYPTELDVAEIWPATASVELTQRNVMNHSSLIGYTQVLYNAVGRLVGGVPVAR